MTTGIMWMGKVKGYSEITERVSVLEKTEAF